MARSAIVASPDSPGTTPSAIPALSALPVPRSTARDEAMAVWLAERRVKVSGVTLEDVVGLSAAKREVQSLIARLRYPDRIREAGGELPRAILFYGPAGTGKTTLARVVASALSEGSDRAVPFYELSGGDLTATRLFALRDHFAARSPDAGYAVAFVDEVDAIALSRHHYTHTPESRRALYALLTVLDGLRVTPNVLWLFTSNTTPDELDSAITRSGRMGHHIETTYPTKPEREALFGHFARGRRLVGELDWAKAAEMLGPHSSGAEVRQVLDDALSLSLADSGEAITDWPHLVEAIQRRGYVSERRQPLDERERRNAATHEAGHALAAALLGLPLSQIVLDDATGGAHTDLEEPDAHRTVGKFDGSALDVIALYLAGNAAERLIFGARDVSLGSSSDLQHATNWALARLDAGLDEGFPLVSRAAFEPPPPSSLRDLAAAAVAATLAAQRSRVERLLADRECELRALARRVAEAENGQLGGEELRRALLDIGLSDPGAPPEGQSAQL